MAVHRSDTAQRAMPPWTEVEASLDVVCKLCERLDDVFPVAELDVVVVGIFHQARGTRAWPLSSAGCFPTWSGPAGGASKRCQQRSPCALLRSERAHTSSVR